MGVLTPVQQSQYGTLVLIINNKEGNTRFITDCHRLNYNCFINPYPLPRITKTIQQLEGFQYATKLDLNMGYYTMRISPVIKYMMMIVTEFGKFKYNFLPMGM